MLLLLVSLTFASTPSPAPAAEAAPTTTGPVCFVRDDADPAAVGLSISTRPTPAGTRPAVELAPGGLLRVEAPGVAGEPTLIDAIVPGKSSLFTVYAAVGEVRLVRVRLAPPSRPNAPAVNFEVLDERREDALVARCKAAPLTPMP